MKKRIISILLTACMITALLPVMGNGVFAAGGLTRAEWITQLVAAFKMTVEDDSNMPDNYFSDITEDDSYYRDILLAVEFGVIDLEAGEAFEPNEPATREFAARSLNACLKYQLDEGTEYTFSESETVTYPDDIQVAINRGWFTLSGGEFLPEQAITSAEAEAMLADAKTTIAGDTVEENYNSQYEFADGVIVVPETADVTIEGEYIVTIANWEGTINTDDIFVVYSYGIPVPLKAESVEAGEEIIITATKEGTDDAIVSADSQGISLTHINIPKSLEDVGYYYYFGTEHGSVFTGSGLSSVEFEEGITSIPNYLFWQAAKLENVEIPDTVTSIGNNAFRECTSLISITMPNSITNMGDYVFYECTSLEKIKLPDNLTNTGEKAFYNCSSLREITIPDSVTSMGTYTFSGCTSLVKAKIPNTRQNIMEGTFYNCKNLTEVNFPNTLVAVRSNAFYGCEKLQSAPLPEGLTAIENSAFYNCKELTEITIPEKVTSVGNSAFENCDGLQKVTVNGSGSMGQKAFYDCDALTDLTISDAVTSIGSNMCYSCDKLTNVKLGRGITTIPDSTFRQCASLTEVTLPRFCTTVASNAFAEDVKLSTVNVPVSVSKIETNSFSYPAKMTFNGKTGSYAEEYALSRNIKFNAVDTPITTIKYADSKMSIGTDTTVLPALTIEPEFDTDTVTFKSSDENILTVSDTGRVTSGWRNYGTAKITATTGSGKSTSIDITVVKTADSISLDNTSLNLDLGTSGKLTASMNPSDAVDVLEWSSSSSDIAEVDQEGNVTAKAKGTAVITVKASYSGVSATCTVTVIPPAEITAFTVDESENGYTANITTADVPTGAAVWVAVYDTDNRLVGIQKVAANKAVQVEFDTPDAANFKAFVWNMTILKPLTNSKEAPVTTGV